MYIVYRKDGAQFVKNYKTKTGAQQLADKLNVGEGYHAFVVSDDLRFKQAVRQLDKEFA